MADWQRPVGFVLHPSGKRRGSKPEEKAPLSYQPVQRQLELATHPITETATGQSRNCSYQPWLTNHPMTATRENDNGMQRVNSLCFLHFCIQLLVLEEFAHLLGSLTLPLNADAVTAKRQGCEAAQHCNLSAQRVNMMMQGGCKEGCGLSQNMPPPFKTQNSALQKLYNYFCHD